MSKYLYSQDIYYMMNSLPSPEKPVSQPLGLGNGILNIVFSISAKLISHVVIFFGLDTNGKIQGLQAKCSNFLTYYYMNYYKNYYIKNSLIFGVQKSNIGKCSNDLKNKIHMRARACMCIKKNYYLLHEGLKLKKIQSDTEKNDVVIFVVIDKKKLLHVLKNTKKAFLSRMYYTGKNYYIFKPIH